MKNKTENKNTNKNTNKKIISGVAAGVLSLSALALVGCGTPVDNTYKNAYISLNINPGIEILTDENGKIKQVTGTNDDGRTVVYGLDLVGKTYEDAVLTLLQEVKSLGYLDAATTQIIDTLALTTGGNITINDDVKALIEKFVTDNSLDVTVSITDIETTPAQQLADDNNISVDKAQLVLVISEIIGENQIPTLVTKTTEELYDILEEARDEREDFYSDALLEKYDALEDEIEIKTTQKEYEVMIEAITAMTADADGNIKINKVTVSKTDILAKLNTLKTAIDEIINNTQATVDTTTLFTADQKTAVIAHLNEIERLEGEMKQNLADQDKETYETNEELLDDEEDALEEILDEIEDSMPDDVEFSISLNAAKDDLVITINEFELKEELIDDLEDALEEELEELGLDDDDLEDEFETELKAIDIEADMLADFETANADEIAAAKTAMQEEKDFLKEIYED